MYIIVPLYILYDICISFTQPLAKTLIFVRFFQVKKSFRRLDLNVMQCGLSLGVSEFSWTLRIRRRSEKDGFGSVFRRVVLDLQTTSFEITLFLMLKALSLGDVEMITEFEYMLMSC